MDANLPNEGDLKGSKLSVNSFKGHSYTYIPSTLSDPISQNPRERTAKEMKEIKIGDTLYTREPKNIEKLYDTTASTSLEAGRFILTSLEEYPKEVWLSIYQDSRQEVLIETIDGTNFLKNFFIEPEKTIKELDITEDIGQFVSVMLEGRRREWL